MKTINEDYRIERVSEDKEDDYIITNGERVIIINNTAGEMLLWIKKNGFNEEREVYDYFSKEYCMDESAIDEIKESIEVFINEGIIVNVQ